MAKKKGKAPAAEKAAAAEKAGVEEEAKPELPPAGAEKGEVKASDAGIDEGGQDPLEEMVRGMVKQGVMPTQERLVAFGRFRSLLFAPENRVVLQKFAIATGCMLVLPVTAFYMAGDLARSYGVADDDAPTYGAVAALITVQFVSFGYVMVAVFEERAMKAAAQAAKKDQ
eukprot:TRINITY_DN27794_c0_g1_i1.p1 TRINITY_DN27794_c0_g1~~TRINITY_DN27794_c0_g1_i1.p1  ORF type:complete len:170 (+),score=72.75 TRINITY_DN27794_c0_g1_i1:67-576(+)